MKGRKKKDGKGDGGNEKKEKGRKGKWVGRREN